MKVLSGRPDGVGRRVAVVAGRYNEVVTSKLVEGALAGLAHHGVASEDITVAWVPGAFEIPLVASRFATGGTYDAVIALGAIIRGDTTHFELVATEAARGIAEVARSSGIPVIFEVLATDDLEQAQIAGRRCPREQGLGGRRGSPGDGNVAGGDREGRGRVIVDKPWGRVVTYALNQPSSVRVVTVEPGAETSIHYHQMRDETWVVLDPGSPDRDR